MPRVDTSGTSKATPCQTSRQASACGLFAIYLGELVQVKLQFFKKHEMNHVSNCLSTTTFTHGYFG